MDNYPMRRSKTVDSVVDTFKNLSEKDVEVVAGTTRSITIYERRASGEEKGPDF